MSTSTQEPSLEPSQRRRGNPAKLVPGVKASQEHGPDGKLRRKQPQLDSGDVDQLAAMRHVWANPESEDRTQLQRECRRWLEDDPRDFRRSKTVLERAAMMATGTSDDLAASAPTAPGGPVKPDEGTDWCEELLGDRMEFLLACLEYRAEIEAWLAGRPKGAVQ